MRDMTTALRLLMNRAEPNLTEADLQELGGASDIAALQASNLASMMNGCGALVGNDVDGGWMQSKEEVSALMWHVASVAEGIAALIELQDRVDVIRNWGPHKPQPDKVAES